MLSLNKMFSPAHCRGGYYFSLDRKVAKDQDSREGFFALRAFALQNRQNRGGKHLRLASPLLACASVKISYALQPHGPASFCRFSAEAFLLSGFIKPHDIARNEAISMLYIIYSRPLNRYLLIV
jgi:hypothetical protein